MIDYQDRQLLIIRITNQVLLIPRSPITDCQDHQPRIIDCQDHQLLIVRITKGGKLDDLNMAPDSSPFIDSVTRQLLFIRRAIRIGFSIRNGFG